MTLNKLKYRLFEVEDVITFIKDNPYRTISGVGVSGLTIQKLLDDQKKRKGQGVNKHQDYEENIDDLGIFAASSQFKKN